MLIWTVMAPQISYVEALTPSVIIVRDKTFMEINKDK